ncbi:MAG: SUF system Fe-S cluster assembly regulator [Candidatus Puniceispirillaceae bacterium]|jgi:FeS assembly SUF system regulator
MLKINRMTDYAILVLGLLHHRGDEQLTANNMAVYLQLNKTTIAKVIRALSQAGLIETSRGIHGGCQLAVDVSKITVASVVEAIEGPIALTACVEGADEACSVKSGCFLSGHWNHVNDAITSALHSITLANLFQPEAIFPPAEFHSPSASVSGASMQKV